MCKKFYPLLHLHDLGINIVIPNLTNFFHGFFQIQPAFLQETNSQTMKNPVDMRRKARSLSSRMPPPLSIKE